MSTETAKKAKGADPDRPDASNTYTPPTHGAGAPDPERSDDQNRETSAEVGPGAPDPERSDDANAPQPGLAPPVDDSEL